MKKVFLVFLSISLFNSFSYSQTELWGAANGSIFKSDVNGDNLVKTQLSSDVFGSLIQGDDGKLYGMERLGGISSHGSIFRYDMSTNTLTTLHNFDYTNTGGITSGTLLQASNGLLYGMTELGGANTFGTLFKYDLNTDTFTVLVAGGMHGRASQLVQGSNGKIYGVRLSGSIFEFDPITEVLTTLHTLSVSDGQSPYGSLFQATNGKLYGGTTAGGSGNSGTIFEYDINTSTFTKLHDFQTATGAIMNGTFIEHTSGILYGLCSFGGVNGDGVVFSFNTVNNTYTKKADFNNSTTGRIPYGSLMKSSNGKFYGANHVGGSNGSGVYFEFDPNTDILTNKADLNSTTFVNPYYLQLIEVCAVPSPTISILSDLQDDCEVTIPTSPEATSCYGTITGVPDVVFPISIVGTTVVTWTFDDGHGNYSTQLQNIIINGLNTSVMQSGITLVAEMVGVSYQWIDCNNNNAEIVGETGQSFTVSTNGNYAVIVDNGNCSDTSECITVNDLGIYENQNLSIEIYPNPSSHTVHINSKNPIQKILITDLAGSIILEQNLTPEHFAKVNISSLSEGIYLLKAIDKNGLSVIKKIIKQ